MVMMAMEGPYRCGGVRGVLHRPGEANGRGVVLAHGAGSNCNAPLLAAVSRAFAAAGWLALRVDLPFRQQRPTGPPFPAMAARDREGLREAALAMRSLGAGAVALGGHSYGGRQATMLAAEDGGVADALLLLSYPLHPPRKASELRTAHLPKLRTASLFVHGTRDPFGSPEEMREALRLIPGRTELMLVEGAGHDLRPLASRAGELPAALAALL
jgi:predicted alpha/beta-hydrolase family hydrolase